jgi:hypothetical protein
LGLNTQTHRTSAQGSGMGHGRHGTGARDTGTHDRDRDKGKGRGKQKRGGAFARSAGAYAQMNVCCMVVGMLRIMGVVGAIPSIERPHAHPHRVLT